MMPFTTFEDSEVHGNDTAPWGPNACHNHWACLRGSFSVGYNRRQPGPSVGHVTQAFVPATPLEETPLWCVAPTNQPSTCLPGEEEKARELPQVTTLLTPPEEVVKPEEAVKVEETEEAAAPKTLVWTQVHPSRPVVPMGLVPHSLGDEWHCWCRCSHNSYRKASLQAENQQSGGAGDSVPNATCDNSQFKSTGPFVP